MIANFYLILFLILFFDICRSNDVLSAKMILNIANKYAKDQIEKSNDNLPFVTISFAQTFDGSIAPITRGRMDISSPLSFKVLHSLRADCDAVLIGVNTLMLDNPQLNVRDTLPGIKIPTSIEKQPRSIILDSNLRFFNGATTSTGQLRIQRPLIFTCIDESDPRFNQANEILKNMNCDGMVINCRETEEGRCDVNNCLEILKRDFKMNRVLIEGGAQILQDVFERGIANQAVLTLQPCFFGGYRALTRQLNQPLPLQDMTVAGVGGDIIIHGSFDKKRSDNNHSNNKGNNKDFKYHGRVTFHRNNVEFIK